MKFSFSKPKRLKINIPKIDFSFLKTEWGMISIGILVCVLIAFLLIKMLSGRDAALLEYRRLMEELENTSTDDLTNNLSDDTLLPTLSFLSQDGEAKGNISYVTADTEELRVKGLSEYDILEQNMGMLFVFDTIVNAAFTMEGMSFPLDIIFLDSNDTVVEIASKLQPCESDCTPYTPASSYQYAIEVNAGVVNNLGIVVGDIVVAGE
ncbi:DUF192 domain-containing protein [Candidatus Dojkabacteria bacterium]|nr:DUF192 domain-containing protein [Candidatus Dojkabacteria bacterium]